jgi:FAD/FMN-containing dehydrogenase
VTAPYNYPFSDNVPKEVSLLADQIISGDGALTPSFGRLEYAVTAAALAATLSHDLWGKSKRLLLYVRPTTLRVTANGYAVLTSRSNVQPVVADFTSFCERLVEAYRSLGRYPMNGPVEIRVTGIDDAADVYLRRAESPVLSAARPRPDQPAWNVAVWLDILTFPGTPYANQFYNELEDWAFKHYSGSYAAIRPEWSKGWAYTDAAAWTDNEMLTATIPDLYRAGRHSQDNWDWALTTLNSYDPHHILSNAFLDRLLP